MKEWSVLCRPLEHEEVRGLGVFITDGDDEREVGRVAFVREKAGKKFKDTEFAVALDGITARADAAVELINDTLYEVERVNERAESERADRERDAIDGLAAKLRDAVGSVPRPGAFE